jgi:HlyD family secretion protein
LVWYSIISVKVSNIFSNQFAQKKFLSFRMQKHFPKKAIPIILLVVIALAVGIYWFLNKKPNDGKNVYVSGRIEGYETNIGAKIGGRVDYIAVREGEYVKKGQLIVKISDDEVQAQLRGAAARFAKSKEQEAESRYQIDVIKSQLKEAGLKVTYSKEDSNSQIEEGEAGVSEARAKLAQSQAELIQSKADLSLAATRKKRYAMLLEKGAVTTDETDQANTTYDTSIAMVSAKEHMVEAARKELSSAKANLLKAKATRLNPGMQEAQFTSLEKQLIQAQYQLKSAPQDSANAKAEEDQINANIAYLTILSPINAVCTARTVEPGAVVSPGQTVLSIIDLDIVYLRGYVPDSQIGRVRIGQKAKVMLDSSPNKPLEGTVIQIDPEASFTPENIYFREDRVKQVFGIKIAIAQPERFAKPGMPADALILIDSPR